MHVPTPRVIAALSTMASKFSEILKVLLIKESAKQLGPLAPWPPEGALVDFDQLNASMLEEPPQRWDPPNVTRAWVLKDKLDFVPDQDLKERQKTVKL